jgi:hypothetical protein
MPKKTLAQSESVLTPEMQAAMQQLARDEVVRMLTPVLEAVGMQVIAPGQTRFVLNPEARKILELGHNALMEKIHSGDLIDGIHFRGRGRRRSWRPDRLERYRATEGDQLQQIKDVTQWQKEGFGNELHS